MNALRRLAAWTSPRAERSAVVEECEPRILYSADLNPAAWGDLGEAGSAGAIVGTMDPAAGAVQPVSEQQQEQAQRLRATPHRTAKARSTCTQWQLIAPKSAP